MTPRASKRDQTIPLGIVGGGSVWETRYRAAVLSLKRSRVAAVYAPVPSEAEALNRETGGQLYYSLRKLLELSAVQALVILESGWVREWAISLAVAKQIPVFVASPVDESLGRNSGGLVAQEAEGAVIVPGSVWRATPATLRLRELVATQLGPIQELVIELPVTGEAQSHVISAIDWCRSLLSSTVSQITREVSSEGQRLIMSCGRRSPQSLPVRTEIRIRSNAAAPIIASEGATGRSVVARVRCEQGEAELTGESHIRWNTANEAFEESLESDRPAEQVLLDLFLRRVVGGVVPVPSWAELHAACQLCNSVHEAPR